MRSGLLPPPTVRPEPVEGPSFFQPRAKGRKGLRQAQPERSVAVAAVLAASLLLAGCGLKPLYGGGASGPVAQTLRSVTVAPIEGRAGWLVRTALEDRLGAPQGVAATYRLEVLLDDEITGFGIRRDDAVTRERRTLRARYRLVDSAKGTVLLDATAGSDAGIDVVGSEYATVAAEQTALERLSKEVADQIVTRVAVYARRSGNAP
jgi:LPS-assembly lipoprotein